MSEKLEISSKNAEKKVSTQIDVVEKNGKMLAIMKETLDGVSQPVRFGFLNVVTGTDTPFLTIDAPLRKMNEDGTYATIPAMKDGVYVDHRGQPVDDASKAATAYDYIKSKTDGSLVYGQVATLNVNNTRADGTPAKRTYISAKIYSDDIALKAARILYQMKEGGEGAPGYEGHKEKLATLRREEGERSTFFINKGSEALAKLGFEVKTKGQESSPEP